MKCISDEKKREILARTKAPYPIYHGTDDGAEICQGKFNIEKIGKHDPGDLGKGIYFHTRKGFSKMYGKTVFGAIVDLQNPLVIDFDKDRDKAHRQLNELEEKYGNPVRGCAYYSTEEILEKAEKRGVHPGKLCHLERVEASEKWRNELKKEGYDGVVAHGYEGRGTTTVVAFDEDAINLTDCWDSLICELCECTTRSARSKD